MTGFKLVCEAVKNNSKSTYYIPTCDNALELIKSRFNANSVPDVVPDYVSPEQKELYYYFHYHDEPMSQKIKRYHTVLDGLGLSSNFIIDNIVEPIFYVTDEELFVNHMVISTRIDSGLTAISFGDSFKLLSKLNLISALDLIGADKDYHASKLYEIFGEANIFPNKLYGFSLFLESDKLLNRINYYFQHLNMTTEEIKAFENMAGKTMIDCANEFKIYNKNYLLQYCIDGDSCTYKYFYNDWGGE